MNSCADLNGIGNTSSSSTIVYDLETGPGLSDATLVAPPTVTPTAVTFALRPLVGGPGITIDEGVTNPGSVTISTVAMTASLQTAYDEGNTITGSDPVIINTTLSVGEPDSIQSFTAKGRTTAADGDIIDTITLAAGRVYSVKAIFIGSNGSNTFTAEIRGRAPPMTANSTYISSGNNLNVTTSMTGLDINFALSERVPTAVYDISCFYELTSHLI